MSRVRALVEGQTEQSFVKQVVAPELSLKGVALSAIVVGKPGQRGGIRSYQSILREILTALKHDKTAHWTTMFDLYGLPNDWPAISDTNSLNASEAALHIERTMHSDICRHIGPSFPPSRFLPYIQLHEFESLLFSGPSILADVVGDPRLAETFEEIVRSCGGPEAIDDGAETAPSKRILKVEPGYKKVSDGTIAAKRIGLATMRDQCPHFNEWIRNLETTNVSQ